MNSIQFHMDVKIGNEQVAHIDGRKLPTDNFSITDLNLVFSLERDLERLFGLRFHINCHEVQS